MGYYNLEVITNLLLKVFDDPQLDALCLAYFIDTFEKFSEGMRRDSKINILLYDCKRKSNGLDNLLNLTRAREPEIFAQFEQNLKSPKKYVIPIGFYREHSKISLLFSELEEWKLVHNETQLILNKLGISLRHLHKCHINNIQNQFIYEAARDFKRHCATPLRLFFKLEFYHAYTEEFELLKDKITFTNTIIRLMMGELNLQVFKEIDNWFVELEDILWNILTEADLRIKILIESLHQDMKGHQDGSNI